MFLHNSDLQTIFSLPFRIYFKSGSIVFSMSFSRENEEISGWKAHINKRKGNWYISMITDVILNQKRVNVKTWHCFYPMFTYIYFLLIEKDISDRWNISIKLPCVCVHLSSGDLFIFSVRVSSFFSYFLIKNILKRSEESNTYLTHVCRHHRSRENMVKR